MTSRILPAIAFAAALGIFFLYVNPMWTGTIAAAKASIAADDQALLAAKQYSAQQNQLAAARDSIDPANLSALSVFLPDSVDNVGIILDLNALAARSGLSVSNIDVVTMAADSGAGSAQGAGLGALPAAPANPVNSVNLNLSALGTFAAFQNFLIGIERSARILDISDIVVKGSDTGVYSYQMVIRLYWLR
jgi:hypothetical protein